MPKYSRKYYEIVAEEFQVLNRKLSEQTVVAQKVPNREAAAYIRGMKDARLALLISFADTFENDNPRFMRELFVKKCDFGYPTPSKGALR